MNFGVSDRVRHAEHGEGTVAEKMHDSRTRVAFNNGTEHCYRPSSLTKLALVRRKCDGAPSATFGGASHKLSASSAAEKQHAQGVHV